MYVNGKKKTTNVKKPLVLQAFPRTFIVQNHFRNYKKFWVLGDKIKK